MESLFQVFFNGFNGYPCESKDQVLGTVFSELLRLLYLAQEANIDCDSSLIEHIRFSYYQIGCSVQTNR
jgi:hypothetical protein